MTFGLDGSIWKKYPGGRSIVFDTIWGPYFLVPLAFAILVLVLEVGLVSRNRRIVQRVMNFAPLMLVLALPWTDGKVFREFFGVFVTTVGSPLWWTCWLLLALYVWASFRGVRFAAQLSLAAGALLCDCRPAHGRRRFVRPAATLAVADCWSAAVCATPSAFAPRSRAPRRPALGRSVCGGSFRRRRLAPGGCRRASMRCGSPS